MHDAIAVSGLRRRFRSLEYSLHLHVLLWLKATPAARHRWMQTCHRCVRALYATCAIVPRVVRLASPRIVFARSLLTGDRAS